MRIPCPYCGLRGNEEFVYRGGGTPDRPDGDDPAAWQDYVYLRDNVAGVQAEYWQHVHGCRAWLVVTRDTRSHVVVEAAVAANRAGTKTPRSPGVGPLRGPSPPGEAEWCE